MEAMQSRCDVLVIGAGIAGASVAWELACAGQQVLLLEREAQPGYHTTGRSAALYSATYGTPAIQALTRASRAFYDAPPAGFADTPILAPRGVAYVAARHQQDLIQPAFEHAQARNPAVHRLDCAALLALLPCLKPDAVAGGVAEPDAADIDVHALHQGNLRGRGARARCCAPMPRWWGWRAWAMVPTGRSRSPAARCCTRAVVNAAGAWADEVARLAGVTPVGLEPRRRTAFTFSVPHGMDATHWPAAIGIAEDWYFKPDAGQLLGSPANADPVPPHDVVPEKLDVALGIHRIEEMTCFEIRRPTRTWAGLRSFVPDGDPVIGWDDAVPGFFWLAGQGGYGIQSAAGAARLARNLLLDEPLDARLEQEGLERQILGPERLR